MFSIAYLTLDRTLHDQTHGVIRNTEARVLARNMPRNRVRNHELLQGGSQFRKCDSQLVHHVAEIDHKEGNGGFQLSERSTHLGHRRQQSRDLSNTPSRSEKDCGQMWTNVSPNDSILSNVHQGRVHVFPVTVFGNARGFAATFVCHNVRQRLRNG